MTAADRIMIIIGRWLFTVYKEYITRIGNGVKTFQPLET